MKKRLFIILIAAIIVLLPLTMTGCSRYISNYKAMAFVHTNTRENASMRFSSFEGIMVFKLKCEHDDEKINYSARLENGSAKVLYDSNGTKMELFFINSGDNVSDVGGVLQKGTVYIIVEMYEIGNDGYFNFDIG